MSRTPPRKSVVEITQYSLQTVRGHSTGSARFLFFLSSAALSPAQPSSSVVGMRSDGHVVHGARGDSRTAPSRKFVRWQLLRCESDGETLPADGYWTDAPPLSAGQPPQSRPGWRCWYGCKRPG